MSHFSSRTLVCLPSALCSIDRASDITVVVANAYHKCTSVSDRRATFPLDNTSIVAVSISKEVVMVDKVVTPGAGAAADTAAAADQSLWYV